jgi:apoptotic chromatin condensation inducer in the nucleus
MQLTRMKDKAWVMFKEPAHAHATRHVLQGVEWPEGNKSALALQFIPAAVAQYAIDNEVQQDPSAALVARLMPQASGGKEQQQQQHDGSEGGEDDTEGDAAAAPAANGGTPAAAAAADEGAERGAKPSGVRGRGALQAAVAAAAASVQQEQQQHEQPAKRRAVQQQQPEPEQPLTLDDLFRKTTTKPQLYYLPLSDVQVAAKKQRQSKADSGAVSGGGGKSEPLGPAVMEGLAPHHTNKH